MRHLFLPFLLFFSISLFGQSISIKGSVSDTLDNPLIRATVLLMEQDSTLVDYTQSNDQGDFGFSDLAPDAYLIKVTYVGYIPEHVNIAGDQSVYDLGTIKMSEIATQLMEVVIKAAKAPMHIRGDTIEYDVSEFKVPDGSTVEDLLKRLEAVDVERDGTIRAEGKVVSKVTVEGKDFFGNDPTTVTKNLPAEGVSKVQVYDRKSEEEAITGAPADSEEKEMNIELKDDFKSGGFGKAIAGYGDQNLAELKGNYNRFTELHQFSVVGVANNTGRNGLNWDDYQDFMGSSSFSFGDYGLDYGFGSLGGMYSFTWGGGGNALESKIQSAFFNYTDSGFPKRLNGGLNYNFDDTKNKLGARYFYNYAGNEKIGNSLTDTYYDEFVVNSTNSTNSVDDMNGHRAEFSFSSKIDSFLTLSLSSNFALVNSSTNNENYQLSLKNSEQKVTEGNVNNSSEFGGYLTKATMVMRKSFRKKGRFFGANMTYLYTDVNESYLTNSFLQYYDEESVLDSSTLIIQDQQSVKDKTMYKANLMYAEPLSKLFFLTVFFNVNSTLQNGVVDVYDESQSRNDYLSRRYQNNIFYQRSGTSIRFTNNGLNISLGVALKNLHLSGKYSSLDPSQYSGIVDERYNNWIPHVSLRYTFMRSLRFNLSYNRNVNEPNITSLLPIVDARNPLYITEGNPALDPEITNAFRASISYDIPVSGFRVYLNTSYNANEVQIIQQQTVDDKLITYSKPVNFEGGNSLYGYSGIHFPIIGKKLKAGFRFSANSSHSFSYVNEVLNETYTLRLRPGTNITIAPNDFINAHLNYNYSQSNTVYNINTSQDQEIINHSLGVDIDLKPGKSWQIETSYDHDFYYNDRFGENTSIPVINLSVSKKFLKGNKGSLRLSVYDLLDKNKGFYQYSGTNMVSQSTTQSISRYVMLSFSYDLKPNKSSNSGTITIIN